MKNVTKYISYMAPCIEVIGYRQKKKGITSFGDLCSDFGANVKFLIGQKKKYKQKNSYQCTEQMNPRKSCSWSSVENSPRANSKNKEFE